MMDEPGAETTPLLLDSLSPPTSSALSHGSYASHRGSRVTTPRGSSSRFQRRSQVHPLHKKPVHDPVSPPSHRQFSSTTARSSRQLASSSSSAPVTPNKIWQILLSLPHRLLCFTSPVCSPCCGLCCCIACIRTSEYGVMQRFGKFESILHPGMHFMLWPMQREAGRISMRIRQLDVHIETKSKDHVFIRVHVSIQYQTNSTHIFESFYSLQSPTRQLTTQAHDILRSTLPQLELDDIFSSQGSIAAELHGALNDNMNQYGYLVHHALICEIKPNDHVKQSMNEIEASKRMKEAMPHKAEAVRIEKVKDAEARAERAFLNGVGTSRERKAIAAGMREVVDSVIGEESKSSGGASISTKGVMDLLLLTQYMDVLTDLNHGNKGNNDNGNTAATSGQSHSSSMFLMHMPETVTQLTKTARECFGSVTSDSSSVKVENLLQI